mmetsp:Transcript_8889/g.15085  ORF Transcript_8889/g.15085 Transcript_8889/m.15085 type:complete len:178 (-) Transcript_8889:447-980(-)
MSGYYDDLGFYNMADGSFYDPQGYFFNTEGYDEDGGFYNSDSEYIPPLSPKYSHRNRAEKSLNRDDAKHFDEVDQAIENDELLQQFENGDYDGEIDDPELLDPQQRQYEDQLYKQYQKDIRQKGRGQDRCEDGHDTDQGYQEGEQWQRAKPKYMFKPKGQNNNRASLFKSDLHFIPN